MGDLLSDQELDVWLAFRQLRRHVDREIAAGLRRDSGISEADYDVLSNVSEAGVIRTQELADRLAWTQSRTSHQLRRMETRGLVDRGGAPEDGRGTTVTLTFEGATVLADALPAHVRRVREAFLDRVDSGHATALVEIAHRVCSAPVR
jgi:DNA-binding MarR family transcriptional regulator